MTDTDALEIRDILRRLSDKEGAIEDALDEIIAIVETSDDD